MDIKDHGVWKRYIPAAPPEGAPANALFSRRESDGADWYEYSRNAKTFAADSIKIVVTDGMVGPAVTDPSLLFPGNGRVLEVSGVSISDPQGAFGRKLYDPKTKTFSDLAPAEFNDPVEELRKRIEALEGKS